MKTKQRLTPTSGEQTAAKAEVIKLGLDEISHSRGQSRMARTEGPTRSWTHAMREQFFAHQGTKAPSNTDTYEAEWRVFQAPVAPWLGEKEMNAVNSFQPVK